MTKKEQRRIVREMMDAQRRAMQASLKVIPSNWDGIELRQLFADYAAGFARSTRLHKHMDRKRRRDYDAVCYEYNLPRSA